MITPDTFGQGFPANAVTADARAILDDTCSSSTLPEGVTAPGIGYDSSAFCRTLQGVQYDGPENALYSAQSVQVDFEFLNAYNTGNVIVGWINDSANAANILSFQNDGNLVWYDGASVIGATGGRQDPQGAHFSIGMSISPNLNNIFGDSSDFQNKYIGHIWITHGFWQLVPNIGFLQMNSSWQGGAVAPMVVDGARMKAPLVNGTPAGTLGHLRLATTGTRSIRVHRIRHFIGPIR